jgi:protein-S-isoprenylcysteine O-methyltransferase Ste14
MRASYILKHFAGTFIFFMIIFISAGRLNYFQGITYVIIGVITGTLSYTVLRPDSELLAERAKPGKGTKKSDLILLGVSFFATLAMYITGGLDSGRYHWSPDFRWSFYGLGILLTFSGQLLFLIAQKQNKFFSSTVRIQTDRAHKVCDTGLYKVIRHPAYLGSILQAIGFPLLFGSVWSIIPAGLIIILHIARTFLEDRTLTKALVGYPEYTLKTPYKIVPFVW